LHCAVHAPPPEPVLDAGGVDVPVEVPVDAAEVVCAPVLP
jgi:hypothetical protein